MNDDRYWSLIDAARSGGPESPSAEPEVLCAVLEPLEADEVAAFALGFQSRHTDLNRW